MNLSYVDFISLLCAHLNHMKERTEEALFHISFATEEPGKPVFVSICDTEFRRPQISCRIDTMNAWRRCRNERDIQKLAAKVFSDLCQLENSDCAGQVQILQSYEQAKSRLCIRLVNSSQVDERNHICTILGDIAMVVYFMFSETGEFVNSMKVPQAFLSEWKKTGRQVISEAMENTLLLTPPRLFCFEEMLTVPDYEGRDFMDPAFGRLSERELVHGLCLSTKKRTNGAAAAMLPGVCRKLAGLLEGDFYLVFTSIHEAMIHRTDLVQPECLTEILKETIEEATPEEDVLTEKIYRYDQKTDRIELC